LIMIDAFLTVYLLIDRTDPLALIDFYLIYIPKYLNPSFITSGLVHSHSVKVPEKKNVSNSEMNSFLSR